MKKYVTFVKDAEESRKVQEALFKAGFKWCDGSIKADVSDQKDVCFLSINNTGGLGSFAYFTSSSFALAADGDIKPINSSSIIRDPFQLDGAKQPEKMIEVGGKEYSESTLQMMIREHGK